MAKYHPHKEISQVIEYAVESGWVVVPGTGHAYCTLRCPQGDRSGCQIRVFSTPQNPGEHARWLLQQINRREHQQRTEE